MNIWPAGTIKPITIIAPFDSTILVYKRLKETSTPYELLLGEVIYKVENTWELLTSFTTGEYIIKVVISHGDFIDTEYLDLSVRSLAEVNLTINQNLIRDDINTLKNKVTSTNSWKAIG